jgi:hypothetical protein
MSSSASPPGPASNPAKDLYQENFVRDCLRLVATAHAHLDLPPLSHEHEPVITDLLVREMRNLVQDPDAPDWMTQLEPLDDPPQDLPDRFGKSQRRIDIEFVLVRRGPRPRFHLEAKRLYTSASVSQYLGPDGLELFVLGEYARDQNAGGMLGYVQRPEVADWQKEIRKGLEASRDRLCVCPGPDFEEWTIVVELESVHVSRHERESVGRPILIFHILLRFH